jgi:glycosyltransferase involved in cell wall biosynthesis
VKLSAVIIAQDEERDLPACLESLRGLADEVVVLDGGSRDRTRALAEAAGARVFERPFDDYAAQKQAALDKARGEWVLSIDADERVSPELAAEIRAAIASPEAPAGFEIPFQVEFMGRRMRFGGLGSEKHLRLFRRARGRFGGAGLHEGVVLDGKPGLLRAPMRHVPYRDLGDYLAKLGPYTSRAAAKRLAQGRRFHPLQLALPPWELFVRLVLRLGLLDGVPGVAWAGLAAFHTGLKYVKLRELERSQAVPAPPRS